MLAPYFFHKTRVQKSIEEICTLFFSCAAQDSSGASIRLSECSFTSKVSDALRAVYGLLLRHIKSRAFAVSVWIVMPQPIAADFDGSSTILADTFPPGFVSFNPFIFHWFNYLKKPKGLVCKVVFERRSTTTARLGFTVAEAIGI